MFKLFPPTKAQVSLIKPAIGCALFVAESGFCQSYYSDSDTEPSIKDARPNMSFSNFGEIVKQTPFKRFPTSSSTEASPKKTLSLNDPNPSFIELDPKSSSELCCGNNLDIKKGVKYLTPPKTGFPKNASPKNRKNFYFD